MTHCLVPDMDTGFTLSCPPSRIWGLLHILTHGLCLTLSAGSIKTLCIQATRPPSLNQEASRSDSCRGLLWKLSNLIY